MNARANFSVGTLRKERATRRSRRGRQRQCTKKKISLVPKIDRGFVEDQRGICLALSLTDIEFLVRWRIWQRVMGTVGVWCHRSLMLAGVAPRRRDAGTQRCFTAISPLFYFIITFVREAVSLYSSIDVPHFGSHRWSAPGIKSHASPFDSTIYYGKLLHLFPTFGERNQCKYRAYFSSRACLLTVMRVP
jgi:hypothetical protein